jgi:hypothetical protein
LFAKFNFAVTAVRDALSDDHGVIAASAKEDEK